MHTWINDYSETAHPAVLEALLRASKEQNPGYGTDAHCEHAASLIRSHFGCEEGAVFFLPGGTAANLNVISFLLRPWQAVIAPRSGHIATHETGAIEGCGHKVLTVYSSDGKLRPQDVLDIRKEHIDEHMVEPAMVYVSQPTEWGTLYTKEELTALSDCCRQQGLFLYLDGARLAMALSAPESGLSPEDLPALCDAFSIGGTKCGLLFGEAVVFPDPALAESFRFHMKRHGSMMSKGFLLGIQFEALFTDGLYEQLGAHANQMAARLHAIFQKHHLPLLPGTCANQVFVTLPNELAAKLNREFPATAWDTPDNGHIVLRYCASWATTPEQIDAFGEAVARCIV